MLGCAAERAPDLTRPALGRGPRLQAADVSLTVHKVTSTGPGSPACRLGNAFRLGAALRLDHVDPGAVELLGGPAVALTWWVPPLGMETVPGSWENAALFYVLQMLFSVHGREEEGVQVPSPSSMAALQ